MAARAPKIDPPATIDDLLAIPEGERRHELIEGALLDKGATSGEHGGAQFSLSSWMGPFGRRPGGRWPGGWWFASEVDIYFDEKNLLRPDVAGWRRERVPEAPRGAVIKERPDWVCEILSTNRRTDLVKKKRIYHRHQVPHCWVIDLEHEIFAVLRWTSDGYLEVHAAERGDTVAAEPFEALPLPVGVLFGDEPQDE